MANWRDELIEAVKTRKERDAEEAERHRKRVEEALSSALAALTLVEEALRFSEERVREKGQAVTLTVPAADGPLSYRLSVGPHAISVELDRETAIIKVVYLEGKPREFDFARDRHIAAADVEEYIGRRAVELVRAAQKSAPW